MALDRRSTPFPDGTLPRRDGGLWIVPLLGARDPGAGARSGLDSSRLHETLRQAGQERCERRGRNLRGHVAPRHAVRADQERGSASGVDAAQDPGIAGQAANHGRQRAARASLGIRPDRAQGHSPGQGIAGARARRRDPSRRGQASNRNAGFAQRRPRRKDRRSGSCRSPGRAARTR